MIHKDFTNLQFDSFSFFRMDLKLQSKKVIPLKSQKIMLLQYPLHLFLKCTIYQLLKYPLHQRYLLKQFISYIKTLKKNSTSAIGPEYVRNIFSRSFKKNSHQRKLRQAITFQCLSKKINQNTNLDKLPSTKWRFFGIIVYLIIQKLKSNHL